MTMYQKIPTTSTRVDPLMLVAAAGIVLLSVAATAAIVRWLPESGRKGAPSVSPLLPATAARTPSAFPAPSPGTPAGRDAQDSPAAATQFASA